MPAPLPIQPLSVAYESNGRWSKASKSCIPGDPEAAPNSRPWIGPAPAVAAPWRVNQWLEDLSLSLFCTSAFSTKINKISEQTIKKPINSCFMLWKRVKKCENISRTVIKSFSIPHLIHAFT